jgi:Protein of unknown function (DUF2637)
VTAADRAVRWSTVAAVAPVAIVAGWVSYLHAWEVVRAHGEAGPLGRLYPATVDGLIYAASMALLDAARRVVPVPRRARSLLAARLGATLFANVLAAAGPLGAAAAAWPGPALSGSYELLMTMTRGHATPRPAGCPQPAPGDVAAAAYRASLAAGAPLSQRAIAQQFGLSRRHAARIAAEITTGHGSHARAPAHPSRGEPAMS